MTDITNWRHVEVIYSKIVARAWADEDFRNKLVSHPKKVFAEYQLELPENLNVKIVPGEQNPAWELPLPPKPQGVDAHNLETALSKLHIEALGHC